MYMVLDPGQFEVIVTNNLFGDIITDLGASLQGGLGFAASGNLHPGRTSMFEPVHGSAPRFAGRNVANPIGAIASVALMLDTLGLVDESRAVDAAVRAAVTDGACTADAGGSLGTREAGDAIVARLRRLLVHRVQEVHGVHAVRKVQGSLIWVQRPTRCLDARDDL